MTVSRPTDAATGRDRASGSSLAPEELGAALHRLGGQRPFAAWTGTNARTVRRWVRGEQDIPRWVDVVLSLMRHAGMEEIPR